MYMELNESLQREFDEKFYQFKGTPIAIYGTGKNAELIVKYVKGYDFFALVSSDLVGRMMYGKEVITVEEAVKKAKVLIIAAIPSSTGIVYARIKDIIPPGLDLLIYDMRGQRLNDGDYYAKNPYWKKNVDMLYQLVDLYDIVSFDIFDTLVMRKVFKPDDIFCIIERRLERENIKIPFVNWRKNSEKEAGKQCCPAFEQIYETMRQLYGLDKKQIEELKRIEICTELEFICCRQAVKEVLLYACQKGKTIYLTTDMYFPKKIIEKILNNCGITCNCEILISCENNASKEDGYLYEVLVKMAGGKKILHIGDNYETDVVNANRQGIDSFWIMSGYDMVTASSIAYMADAVSNLSDRIMLGTFIADLFNNPFSLNESRGKLNLDSYHCLAYTMTPITILFLKFIITNSRNYDCLLFPSRDGYFLNSLFQVLKERQDLQNCSDGIYFYASRSAINRATVQDENDIITVCSKLMEDYQLNIKEFLKMQFLIDVDDELDIIAGIAVEQWGEYGLWKRILIYKDKIIRRANEERQRYLKYLRKEGINQYHKLAIVDIVTQGTLVYGLSKMTGMSIDLIALGTSAIPNRYVEDTNRVKSIFGNVNGKVNGVPYSFSDFSELHLFLEMIYASCEGQFAGFGEDGRIETNDNEYDCELLDAVQSEMMCIMKALPDYSEMDITPQFALEFLRLLYNRNSIMPDDMKKRFTFSDPYDVSKINCNLMECIR